MGIKLDIHSHGSLIAMFAALGLALPMAASALPADCPDRIFDDQASAVKSETTNNGNDTFNYLFRLCNISGGESPDLIRDWELPFFGTSLFDNEAGIGNFVLPTFGDGETNSWGVQIEKKGEPNDNTGWDGVVAWHDPSNPFFDDRYLATDYVLHFYTGFCEGERCFNGDNIDVGDDRIFGFTADYGPTGAPYQASWIDRPVRTGDPDFPLGGGFPNSPSLQQHTIPEPGSLALAALGLGLLARRRNKT